MKKNTNSKFKIKLSRRRKKLAKGLPATNRTFVYDVRIKPHQTDTKRFNNIKITRPKNTKGKLMN